MSRIISKIDTASAGYKKNQAAMSEKVKALQAKVHKARFERPVRDIERLHRQKKLTVRERLDLLLDPGTPFLELSTLAANKAYDGEVQGAGQVSGIGIIHGREVIIHADDPSIKGGAWYPLSVKKIVRTLDIAIENRLPVIHLCDSAGGFLPLQSDLFPDKHAAGRIFRNQCTLSKMGVPQIAVVLGHCTAGGAYIPALCDYSVIVRGNGGVFLGGPPLVKAATGEIVTAEALGGATMHTTVSGTCDYAADDEPHAMAIARDIFANTSPIPKQTIDRIEAEAPFYDPMELYGIVPTDWKTGFDMREVAARIVDGSNFHEYQPDYGTTMICGYARIWGCKVGILANNGVLFNDSSLKAAHFMRLCDRDRTPLVFLQNITGYMVGREYEERGITKDGAKMIMTQVGCTVPKFTVIVGGSFGAGNYGMCGRAFDGRFLWMWPQSQIAVMGAEQAANTLADVKIRQLQRQGHELNAEEIAAIRDPVLASFEAESDAYYSTSELWDDGILDPVDTRNALGMAIVASLNAPFGDMGYGVLRL
ncbi:acyl-CoA carboxylase subunit beta [Polaromonas sp.]|uniref:acyl-CoA carboxylase subunit beta n=1 Tax=Polaromonas sp. TaxID=1869339 RepID=UPI0035638E5E